MSEVEGSYAVWATAGAAGNSFTVPSLEITSTGSGTGTGQTYSAAYQAALGAATTAAATSRDLVKQTVEVLWRSLIVRFKKELKYEPATFYLTFDEGQTDYGNIKVEINETDTMAFYQANFNGYVYSGEGFGEIGKGSHLGSIIANIKQSTTDTSHYDFNIQVNSSLCTTATMKAGIKDDDDITYNLSSIMTWMGSFTTTANPFESEITVDEVVLGILNNTLNGIPVYTYDAMQTNLTLDSPGMNIAEGPSRRPKKKQILNADYTFGEADELPLFPGQVYKIDIVYDTGFTSTAAP
jgi:hypothetical protein